MIERSDIENQIVLASHRLYDRGYVTATDGNVSARLSNGNILITPSSLNKGRVTRSDLVEVKPDGSAVTLSRKPSSELPMHLFVYGRRSDVNAIVHAHPPYATGFATARVPFPETLFPEVILDMGKIPLAPYATPTTREVPESLEPYVRANAILLANHGVVAFGTEMDEAGNRMEKVEHAAHILFVARMLGGEKPLTEEEIAKVRSIGSGGAITTQIASIPRDVSEQDVLKIIREVLEEKRSG